MAPQVFKIEHRGSKWVVTSEDGSKVLGTHDTKEDAEKQLRAVEASKAAKASALTSGELQAFDGLRGEDGRVRAGVWDRFTSWGDKIKDGRHSVFDENTLGQMIDNWLKRGDKLAMCANHQSAFTQINGQPAPALAFYDGLAIVKGGEVLRCEYLPSSAAQPLTTSIGDGLYGFRCEVTELGQELLPNFKYISPMFTEDGRDEQDNPIGYVIFDVACTNTPFQSGCEITFDKRSTVKLSKLAKFVAMEESADDSAIKAAIMSKLEDEAMKAMEDDAYDYDGAAAKLEDLAKAYEDSQMEEEEDGEPPHSIMRKMAAKFRRLSKMGDPPFGGKETPEEEAAEEKEMKKEGMEDAKGELQAFAQRLGVNLPAGASAKQIFDAVSAAAVPASQIPALVKASVDRAIAEAETKRQAAETAAKAKGLVAAAIDGGYPKDQEAALYSFASNPQTYGAAEALVRPFIKQDGAALLNRMTAAGAPLGADARTSSVAGPDTRVVRFDILGTNATVYGERLAEAANEMADSEDPKVRARIDRALPPGVKGTKYESFERLNAAYKLLEKDRPDLVKAADENGF